MRRWLGEQLVVATRPHVLHEVIDAAAAARDGKSSSRRARPAAAERPGARARCTTTWICTGRSGRGWPATATAISIYNLVKLYDVSVEDAGSWRRPNTACVTSVPTAGTIITTPHRDQVVCSVHGNRQRSRQRPELGGRSSFAQLLSKIDQVTAMLRFEDEALMATVEIARRRPAQ